MSARIVANERAAVATDVVKGVRLAVVVADKQDRIGIEVQAEVIARVWDFAGMTGEKPAFAPHDGEIEFVDFGIGVERRQQAMGGRLTGD